MLLIALLGVVLSLSLYSCKQQPHGGHDDVSRHAQLDSTMDSMHNIDTLTAIVQQSHDQNDALGEMVALRHLGREMRSQAMLKDAVLAHTGGLELAKSQRDTLEMAMMLSDLATDYRRLGDWNKASNYYYEALGLCDSYSEQDSDEIVKVRVSTMNGIGKIEMKLRNFTVADSLLRLALEGERKLNNYRGMAVNYSFLGAIKRDCGERDSAWVYFLNSMDCNNRANNKVGIAMCHMHFGELHEEESRYSHALEEYKTAYNELKAQGDSWYWLESCLALVRVCIRLGEKSDALTYLAEADAESRRIDSKEHQAAAYKLHCELAMLDGKPDEAFKYFVKSDELYDSILGVAMAEDMRAQRIKYERDRNIGEVDVLNRDISNLKRSRNWQWLFIVLMTLMSGAIIAVLIYAVRVRARTQRLMRQVEETRSLFFTNVVHQLRTPLTAIMGAIDDVLAAAPPADEAPGSSRRENAEVIERQGQNLLLLVDRILEVGGVRSAITELDWRTCDAVGFIRMVLESCREHCVERHIELVYAPRESNIDIDTVPSYLNTILCCLIENAVNYSRDYGKITVTSRTDGNMFVIRVADNGMGISKGDLQHVFEPFFRSAAAEQIVEGVGIGLTVVRDMVMAMGGSVAADSMKDHGSVFTVKLPLHHAGSVKQRLDEMVQPLLRLRGRRHQGREQEAEDPVEGKPVVLVIEDHTDVAHMVGLVLKDKYNVQYATDGEQGLAKAQDLVPDLIVTDVKMPVMDGCELCRQVRASRRLRHIPVIMLSARNGVSDRIRGIEAGADVYLVKPFDREEMLAWADNLINGRQVWRENLAADAEDDAVTVTPGTALSDDAADRQFLADFAAELDKQLAGCNKLDIDKIARKFKMGESQLRRRIHQLTGKNAVAYVSQLRMEKAMRLLREDSDLLIGDIAERCGFADVAYFSRVFRQHYGKTPTQARNDDGNQ